MVEHWFSALQAKYHILNCPQIPKQSHDLSSITRAIVALDRFHAEQNSHDVSAKCSWRCPVPRYTAQQLKFIDKRLYPGDLLASRVNAI